MMKPSSPMRNRTPSDRVPAHSSPRPATPFGHHVVLQLGVEAAFALQAPRPQASTFNFIQRWSASRPRIPFSHCLPKQRYVPSFDGSTAFNSSHITLQASRVFTRSHQPLASDILSHSKMNGDHPRRLFVCSCTACLCITCIVQSQYHPRFILRVYSR
ncbi:unnamed protein product [Peniophora sp. CBMAI 1063]|nr:unnamed protein product [Peniophora sp. CBMAI 1063]